MTVKKGDVLQRIQRTSIQRKLILNRRTKKQMRRKARRWQHIQPISGQEQITKQDKTHQADASTDMGRRSAVSRKSIFFLQGRERGVGTHSIKY